MVRYFKTLTVCAVMVFAASLAGSNIAVAQSSPAEKLTTVLPDDMLGFIATSGADDLKPAFEKTVLSQIWKDPGFQSFYQAIYKELTAKIKQEADDPNADKAIDIDTILNFARLVKSRPVIFGAAQKQAKEGPPVYGFAILDAGPRKAEIAAALTELEAMADEGDIVEVKIGSATLHGPKDADDVPGYWGWVGNYLVFAINDGAGLAVKYLQGAPTGRPAPNYLQKVPAGNDALAFYANPEKALKLFEAIAKMEGEEDKFALVEAVIKELGIDKVKTITSRVGFDGSDVVVNELVEIPQPLTGLLAGFKTIDIEMFDMVDARAMGATALNCDMAGIYDTVMKAIKAGLGENFAEVEQAIAGIEGQLKFKIRDGLLESLKGRTTFYSLPGGIMAQAPQGGFVMIAQLTDVKLWEQTMAALGKFAAEKSNGMVQISEQVQNEITLHTWAVAPLAMAQVMPTWTISDDRVIISSSPAMCISAIEQIVSGKQSIRSTEGFKKATANLPENLSGLQYNDSKVQFNQMMMDVQQFWPMLTMAATNAGLKLPFMLPSLTHITEKMGPSCQYSWYDTQGVRSHYRGAGVEQSIGAVVGSAVGLGVMMPALARARGQARRVVSMSNLKQLGLASIIYADDHDGSFPESFDQMKEYIGTSKILESPLKPKDFDGPSYIYVKGHSTKAGTVTTNIIAYENPEYCSEGINVLFMDGHVEWMRPDAFIRSLKATYQQLDREMPEIKFKD